MKDAQKDFLTGLFFLIFGLVVRIFIIPNQASSSNAFGLPPSFFPNIVTYIIMALSILIIINSVTKDKDSLSKSFKMFITTIISKDNKKSFKNSSLVFLICIGYFIGLKYFEFIFITPVIIILMALYFGWRRWVSLIITAVSVTFAIQYLFESLMKIPLP